MKHSLARLLAGLFGATLAFGASHAQVADFPNRPIRLLVPYAPGGVADTNARILAGKMNERLGWNMIVENRPGARGQIASTAVAKATPDGYTLLAAHTGEFAINPAVFPNIQYELDRDFIAITMISDTPMVVLAHKDAPFNTLPELVAAAKAKPGEIGFSTPGTATVNHIAGEWLAYAAGIKLLHVPYKGGAPAATAVAAGEVPIGVVAIPGAIPHLKSGRVKVLGVTTAKRTTFGPQWVTPKEAGIGDVDASNWVGVFAPKGVPKPIVDRLHAEILKTLDMPDTKQRMLDAGGEPAGMSQAAFLAKVRRDAERYRVVVKAAGVKAE